VAAAALAAAESHSLEEAMFAIRSSRASRRAGNRHRGRRGIAVLMFAVCMMLLMMFVAIAADFSRLYVARNALQTAADAGALAGAVELLKVKTAAAGDTAKLYAAKNKLFDAAIPEASVTIQSGQWTDATAFTASAWDVADAVRVIVSRPVAFQFARLFGINERMAIDTAIGWSGANVEGSKDCLKPWAMPLHVLRDSIAAYARRTGAPSYNDTTAYNLSPTEGTLMNQMFTGNAQELNFTMKQGVGTPDYNSGNFQSVQYPPRCTLEADNSYDCSGNPISGANAMAENIKTCSSQPLGIGDILYTQTGVAAGPTLKAINEYCDSVTGIKDGGCDGVRVKASFFTLPTPESLSRIPSGTLNGQPAKDGGNMPIEIRSLGSFIMTSVSEDNTVKGTPMAQITGRFVKEEDTGTVGPNPSLLQRVILVK
jgi:Flp pilus assembly protein TadG